jgi:hypothetical protein
MRVEFVTETTLCISSENILENIALKAWSEKYFNPELDARVTDVSLLIELYGTCSLYETPLSASLGLERSGE